MTTLKPRLVQKPRACECGDHAFVSLTQGFMIRFDIEDASLVGAFNWSAQVLRTNVYAVTNTKRVDGRRQGTRHLHRMLLNVSDKSFIVDHADRDGLNNKRSNIRAATASENTYNRLGRPDGASKYKGVRWNPRKSKWTVRVQFEGIVVSAGYCKDEMEAAHRYDKIAKRLHGEFAALNFPDAVVKEI